MERKVVRKKRRKKSNSLNILKMKNILFAIVLVIIGNFIRLYIEEKNVPDIDINDEVVYQTNGGIIKDTNTQKSVSTEKQEVNSISYEELIQTGFTRSQATKIIEYRDFVGDIEKLEDLKRISRFGDTGMDKAKKHLVVQEKENKIINKHNINALSNSELKLLGFTKKEMAKLEKMIASKGMTSSIDLLEVLGEERYMQQEKYIKYND